MKKVLFIIIFLNLLTACRQDSDQKDLQNDYKPLSEITVKEIELEGIASERFIEASGLAWFNDYLVILPQYPHKVSDAEDGALLVISKKDIIGYLNSRDPAPLSSRMVPFIAEGLDDIGKRSGGGYEAIAFNENEVFVSIESFDHNSNSSYLVSGRVIGDLESILISSENLVPIESKTGLKNIGEEAIVYYKGSVICIHEANGRNNSKNHTAAKILVGAKDFEKVDFPIIEYRITDATVVDSFGNFWVMNYMYPGENKKLKPADDYFAEEFGMGKSNYEYKPVERLLKLNISGNDINYTADPPIYIEIDSDDGRNWEGLVKLDDLGFLVITDYYPRTLFGFIQCNLD